MFIYLFGSKEEGNRTHACEPKGEGRARLMAVSGYRLILKDRPGISESSDEENVGPDMDGGHDIAHEKITEGCPGWREDCRPIFLREDSEVIGNWPVFAEKVREWMEEARLIAVGGYKRVLENGPDVPDQERDSEHSDHGQEIAVDNMSTPEMIGEDGKPKNGGPQVLSEAQVLALGAAAHQASHPMEPTTQAKRPPAGSTLQQPATQAPPKQSRSLVSVDVTASPAVSPKLPKKRKAAQQPSTQVSPEQAKPPGADAAPDVPPKKCRSNSRPGRSISVDSE
jgi:hypothetical protein